ncbi:MAG: hypothetical protein J6X60_02905, partial [Ruminiclostridium sp.]|nr:hypothetical protein [Ruminiclostridium sp.]
VVDALFGDIKNGGIKSRLSVSDSFADMNTVKTEVRHSTALGSVSQSAKTGSLNNMQVVTGGRFPCCIALTDSTEKEIIMLLKAVKAIDSGDICIGGKISRGFGRMNVVDFSIVISDGYDKTTLRPIITDRFDSIDTAEKEIESLMKKTKGATV